MQSGYLPDLDQVLEKKMGICFDYASLTAALLRVQGIAVKLVIGYADNTYHAWNEVYLSGQWVRPGHHRAGQQYEREELYHRTVLLKEK